MPEMPAPTISTSTCSTPSSILVLAGCVIVMPDPPVHAGGAPRRAPSCRCSYHRRTPFCGLDHFCHFPRPWPCGVLAVRSWTSSGDPMSTPTIHAPRTVQVGDIAVAVQEYGDGEPLLVINGTSQSLGFWADMASVWAVRHRVITYDLRGMGGSERGSGEMTVASLAQDALGLLDALEVERTQVLGYSLGSAIAQELALAAPERVSSLVLYCTWARADGYQRAMMTGLAHPWRIGDVEAGLGALGVAFSPQLLDSLEFGALIEQLLPLFPSTPQQIATCAEQWDADMGHDTLDRLGQITAPTLVIAGEQDLLAPPWHGAQVAEAIPGARLEMFTGPGSSHALGVERAEEFLPLVADFLAEHSVR